MRSQRFRAALQAQVGERLRELVVFGSHARGEAGEDSDVDVLVVVDGLTHTERREILGLAYDADAAGEWAGLSPLVYSTEQAADLRSREKQLMRASARGSTLMLSAAPTTRRSTMHARSSSPRAPK